MADVNVTASQSISIIDIASLIDTSFSNNLIADNDNLTINEFDITGYLYSIELEFKCDTSKTPVFTGVTTHTPGVITGKITAYGYFDHAADDIIRPLVGTNVDWVSNGESYFKYFGSGILDLYEVSADTQKSPVMFVVGITLSGDVVRGYLNTSTSDTNVSELLSMIDVTGGFDTEDITTEVV